MLLLFPLFLSILSFFLSSGHDKLPENPNIILIYMDDLGYGDLSCYGALTYKTPALDQLAANGMRFTNFLTAQAVCSASRAALLTGCYPNRLGVSGAYFPNAKLGLNPGEMTLAELVKPKNYKTVAIGKWHLGDHPSFMPLQQGFDAYFGLPYSNDMWPVHYDGSPSTNWKKSIPVLPIIQNRDTFALVRTLEDQENLTKQYTERAISFIETNKKGPFFLYLAHSMPHVPLAVSKRFKDYTGMGLFADVMAEMDWSVDTIVQTLSKLGISKKTLIIFTSDNGPWLNYGHHAGNTGGFREGKGTTFEGGHRVPAIISWPGVVPSGTVCNQLTSTIDIFPTLAELLQIPLPKVTLDGISFLPFLNGQLNRPIRREFLYYYRKNALEAVRYDHWKLVFKHPGRTYTQHLPGENGFPGSAPEDFLFPMALYDLRRDPAECYDVQEMYPEIVAQLNQIAQKARADLGDELTNSQGMGRRPVGKVD
jgi:arylsulfatase